MNNVVKLRTPRTFDVEPDWEADIAPTPGTLTKGCVIPLGGGNGQSQALALANAENFFAMCRTSLWGNESREEFDELLIGLIKNYKPTTRWKLELLANIVDVQWKIRRLRRVQAGVFQATQQTPGKHGVSSKTMNAMDFEEDMSSLLKELSLAQKIYEQS